MTVLTALLSSTNTHKGWGMKTAIVENGFVLNVVEGEVEGGVPVAKGERPHIGFRHDPVNGFEQPPTRIEVVTPKQARDKALQSMVFTGSSGVAIQCRPQDEQNMRSAIDIMTRESLTEYNWYAADNTWTLVTIADLENAIISGQDQGAAIWAILQASA